MSLRFVSATLMISLGDFKGIPALEFKCGACGQVVFRYYAAGIERNLSTWKRVIDALAQGPSEAKDACELLLKQDWHRAMMFLGRHASRSHPARKIEAPFRSRKAG